MELLFDIEFSLSDGEISEDESTDTYCYGVKEEIVREVGKASWLAS